MLVKVSGRDIATFDDIITIVINRFTIIVAARILFLLLSPMFCIFKNRLSALKRTAL
jgi:hypothetical protein